MSAAGIFGLFHPGGVAEVFGASSSAPDGALARIRAKAESSAPRLDVSYEFYATPLVDVSPRGGESPGPNEPISSLGFPIIENAVMSEFRDNVRAGGPGFRTTGCDDRADSVTTSVDVAFLIIRNRGQRDATDIALRADRLALDERVPVNEAGDEDYIANLRAAATTSEPDPVHVPFTLGPGEGLRVPLWASYAFSLQYDRWCVVSQTAFLPRSLSYSDPQLRSVTTSSVRRLRDPSLIADGVVGRG